jgi:Flp pilus assembly pilin Flp
MKTIMQRFIRDERGLSTAEYAVGTVAVAGLGGVLAKLLMSDTVRDMIWNVIRSAFSSFLGG